jgi:hypothetical protein
MAQKPNWEIEVQRIGDFTFRYNLGLDDDISIRISSKEYTESAVYVTLRELVNLLNKSERNFANQSI